MAPASSGCHRCCSGTLVAPLGTGYDRWVELGGAIGFRVEVLGELSVRLDDGERWPPGPMQAKVILALALAGVGGRTKAWLENAVWDKDDQDSPQSNALAANMLRIRRYLPISTREQGGYALNLPEEDIDAWVFLRGVEALNGNTPSAQVDFLLKLWKGDPRDNNFELRAGIWDRFTRARAKLVSHVLALPDAERARLEHWLSFQEIFHRDSAAWRDPAESRSQRKKVLVVDDKIGADLALVLEMAYDCTVLKSFPAATQWLREERINSIDCAVVDRHLTESMTDALGESVILKLRQARPDLAIVLMSAALAEADMDDEKARLGVNRIIHKSNAENGVKTMIFTTVSKLIGA